MRWDVGGHSPRMQHVLVCNDKWSATDTPYVSLSCLCRLNDLVGSDVGLHVGKNFVDSFPERVYISQLIPLLNQHKRLGEKTGKGFYKVGVGLWGLYGRLDLRPGKQ